MKICRKLSFYNLQKSPFGSIRASLYSKENLKLQKIFKFTKDPEKKEAMQEKEFYLTNLKIIKVLEKEIFREEVLALTTPFKEEKNNKKMMRKDEDEKKNEDFEEEVTYGHRYSPIHIGHMDQMSNLKARLAEIKGFNNYFQQKYSPKSTESQKEYGFLKASIFRDVFSSSYSFGNRMLNPLFFESVNQPADERPGILIKEENDINLKQHNLESEIHLIVKEMLDRDLKNFDVESTAIPHNLPVKPVIRTVLVDQNQPDILLLEGDLNCNYDIGLEYERIVRLNQNDDFGRQIKDEQVVEEDDQEEEIQQEEVNDKDLFGLGNIPSTISVDTSISVIANK